MANADRPAGRPLCAAASRTSAIASPAPPRGARRLRRSPEQRLQRQAEDREPERPLKALDGDLVHARLEILARQLGQHVLVQRLESPSIRAQPSVIATRHARDRLQGVLVELRAHEGALLVAHELPGPAGKGDQLARVRADADGVDVDAVRRPRARPRRRRFPDPRRR